MCALFGWLDYKGIVPHNIMKKLTQSLANAAEERGTDASGIAYVKDNRVTIFKRPKPAHKVHFNVPDVTKAVMGHTRMTTQGNEKHNFNNHPFYGFADKEFAFAHNGVLNNDSSLRKEKNLPKTHIETDSYIAVQLIEKSGKLDFESLQSMAEDVSGSFCFTALDAENSLYIVKGSNPMCLLHFEQFGFYVYASTESIMKNALKKVGLLKYECEKIETVDGDIIKINSNGKLSRSQFEVKDNFSYRSWYNWFDEYEDFHSEHEQLLLEMCGFYGVDSEDIELLLDYGYSPDEIEIMLCDYSVIHNTLRAIKGEDEFSGCPAYM